jgi:hypothetical protein
LRSAASFPAAMKRRAPTGSVAMGFSVKTCFAGVDRRFEMHRPEAGRGAEHHDIDIGGEQLLVGVEAGEVMVGLDADARLDGGHQVLGFHLLGLAVAFHGDAGVAGDELGVAQAGERLFEVVFEDIRHAGELDVLVAGEQVHDGLRAASAAAHQAGLQPGSPAARATRGWRMEKAEAPAPRRLDFEQAPAGNTIGFCM